VKFHQQVNDLKIAYKEWNSLEYIIQGGNKMNEQTLVLLKPDAVKRNLIGKILTEYERNGLEIAEMKMMIATTDIAEQHYREHKEKSFYNDLINYITSGPLVALIIEGVDSINRVRNINGATDPEDSGDNTIRALYGLSLSKNTVHASDSPESAKKEINIWFQ